MAEFSVAKGPDRRWHGIDEDSAHELKKFRRWYRGLEPGEIFTVIVKQKRDSIQHRRFMAMLRLAFNHWVHTSAGTPLEHQGRPVKPTFDRFRKDVLVMAGFGVPVFRLDGTYTLEATSVSFERMKQDTFDEVYPAVRGVLLDRVFTNYTASELDRVLAEELQRF